MYYQLLNFAILVGECHFQRGEHYISWSKRSQLQKLSNNLKFPKKVLDNHEQAKSVFKINFKGKLEQAKRIIYLKINFQLMYYTLCPSPAA